MRKASHDVARLAPQSFSLSLDLPAREAFFAYYVPDSSKYWTFLKNHYRPVDSSPHLKLAIEAVSLAYLWHQVYSETALVRARQKYVAALHTARKLVRSPTEATKDTTLLMALMLDVFEKIVGSQRQNASSWTCHVNGALALVNLRGLKNFQGYTSIRILIRLSTDYLGDCITSFSPVPPEWIAIRAYAAKHLDPKDTNWRLSEMLVPYANLRSGIRMGTLSIKESIAASIALDSELQLFELELPPSWQYSSTVLDQKSEKVFDFRLDSYPSRHACYGRNCLRLIRILVNESLLDLCLALPDHGNHSGTMEIAEDNIRNLARELCACVPQYVDCDGTAGHKLPLSERSDGGAVRKEHYHTPTHQLDCYTVILPLYVAGRSDAAPGMRSWAISQLHYISGHFYIRMAQVVAQILEGGTDVDPWQVNAMLGSYAFAA